MFPVVKETAGIEILEEGRYLIERLDVIATLGALPGSPEAAVANVVKLVAGARLWKDTENFIAPRTLILTSSTLHSEGCSDDVQYCRLLGFQKLLEQFEGEKSQKASSTLLYHELHISLMVALNTKDPDVNLPQLVVALQFGLSSFGSACILCMYCVAT
ncbi:hypothetical protein K439DRAFT_1622873 [Ramaria rubella]|nr:hypothetical protein K439DRAFT_1622873 [Ramaria rubella]